MAKGLNKVMLLGNLGADPELKYTANGAPVCALSLATNESYKDQAGQWRERAEWHRVVVYGKTAESVAQYLTKGRTVFVEGKLRARKWRDQAGQERQITEIVADDVQFLGGKPTSGGQNHAPAGADMPF